MAVTVQVNLAPADYPYAQHVLPHQLRQLDAVADEILLVNDLHRSPGRFGAAWEERKPLMDGLLASVAAAHRKVRVEQVDYSDATRQAVAQRFFAGKTVPQKDHRGGPFYSYMFALHAARHERIFHLDSDMLIGGSAAQWFEDAGRLLEARQNVLSVSPHPGGPGDVKGRFRYGARRDPATPNGIFLREFSTRVFLLDRQRLPPIRPGLAPPIWIWRALRAGNPPYREPEVLIGREMRRRGLEAVTMPGSGAGMFVIHMAARGEERLRGLPQVIARVEQGALPPQQAGVQDVHQPLSAWG